MSFAPAQKSSTRAQPSPSPVIRTKPQSRGANKSLHALTLELASLGGAGALVQHALDVVAEDAAVLQDPVDVDAVVLVGVLGGLGHQQQGRAAGQERAHVPHRLRLWGKASGGCLNRERSGGERVTGSPGRRPTLYPGPAGECARGAAKKKRGEERRRARETGFRSGKPAVPRRREIA